MSATEVMVALYFKEMNIRADEPDWVDRDRFVLSKGHAAPTLYACLAESGSFPVEELETIRKIGSRLQGHPDMRKTPGVDASTGSEGQGLSMGIGMALAAKLDRKKCRIYVMLGDGDRHQIALEELSQRAGDRRRGAFAAASEQRGQTMLSINFS